MANIELTFIPVGHLLGAAAATLKINDAWRRENNCLYRRYRPQGYPVLNDPEPLPPVDYLVTESTYGGRMHTKGKTVEEVWLRYH
jgi:metallo-beta-lactamase family protein